MKVDVIIPVYRPKQRFLQLLEALEKQSCPVGHIFIMNTEKTELEKLISCEALLAGHPKVVLTHLSQEEFDHGATRTAGVRCSDAPVFVCMTQDALPADDRLVEKLIKPLEEYADVAVSYARQLPEADCGVLERYTRQFNYPAQSRRKGEADISTLGIKTYFCSNVCAAYRREIFDALGGFVKHTIFNEDMIYAAQAVKAGYQIAYAAQAQVIHSHNYTARQQFSRNFDLGVSHAQYPEIFAAVPPEKEGSRLVKKTAAYLLKTHPLLLGKLFVHSVAKLAGYQLGKRYERLPYRVVIRCSMQKGYWRCRGQEKRQ